MRSRSVRISVPLPTPDGPVMTKTRATASAAARGYRRSWPTSSLRWRWDNPPIVLLGEMRHCCRTLLTFTRPYLGTARSMSKTFAVSRYSGGWSRSVWIDSRPALRSRLSWARLILIWLARARASIRWLRERSGAVELLAGPGPGPGPVAVVMGGESTPQRDAIKANRRNSPGPQVEVE